MTDKRKTLQPLYNADPIEARFREKPRREYYHDEAPTPKEEVVTEEQVFFSIYKILHQNNGKLATADRHLIQPFIASAYIMLKPQNNEIVGGLLRSLHIAWSVVRERFKLSQFD